MWSSAAEMMMNDILVAVRQENEGRRTGIIEFIINCLKPVYEWLQALIWGKDEPRAEPFNVSEYSRRREKFILSLEEERRAEHTIVLWLGYDGLRLNKDGSWEWISRKPPEPVSQGVFYQPVQSMAQASHPIDYSMCQQATREQLFGLRMQLEMQNFNAAMQNQMQSSLQSFVIQTPMLPSYIYAGSIQSPLTGCCCNQTILR